MPSPGPVRSPARRAGARRSGIEQRWTTRPGQRDAVPTDDEKVVCFFRSGKADEERYSSFGFSTEAGLDDPSGLWPASYAVTALTGKAEEEIAALVRRAASRTP
ncbi:hypothetical protein ACFO4E_15405 [Nocardiopsis mangrovi]|uniref:Uncharacterized protein n=1 Tax=Nocardiopsis mangrovi TaxID=1179818 RepID=A0ABV9DWJ1_9ACTN